MAATKLLAIFPTIFLLLALICCQCEATLGGVDDMTRKGDASTIAYPISHSKFSRNSGTMTMDAVRHLEGEEKNVHVHTTKYFFTVLLAIFIVNGITLVALLSLIPVFMNTRWNYFKSTFWVAATYAHTPIEITKKHAKEPTSSHLADIFVPSFVCGTILATALFLVIPEAILLIQRGTSSEEGEIEILSGTISRFGAAVMTGYMLPLVLGALFPRSPERFNTNSNSDGCEPSSDLPVPGTRYGLFSLTNRSRSHSVRNENGHFLGIPMRQHHQEKTNEEERHEEDPRTILGSKIRMPVTVPMPAVFERLSQTETVSFFHQKWTKIVAARKQREPTSAKVSQEEQMIDNRSQVNEDGTVESTTDNAISATNNISNEVTNDSNTNINEQESNNDEESAFENKVNNTAYNRSISGELTIEDNVEINELDSKERSILDSKCTSQASDRSIGEGLNAKNETKEYDKINFGLATSIFIGDILHNFFDGIFIGVVFKTCSQNAAVYVTMITVYKEISHEIAGYFLLTKYAGISIPRAVLLIFTSDLAAIVGALLILNINQGELAIGVFLAIASGVYLHISASECQPRVYSVVKVSKDRWLSVLFFVSGALPVGLTLLSHGHCDK